jgi:hypothetical protein
MFTTGPAPDRGDSKFRIADPTDGEIGMGACLGAQAGQTHIEADTSPAISLRRFAFDANMRGAYLA